MSKQLMSWNDRFALIDHYKPADTDICAAFGVDQSELETARQLRSAGTFIANGQLDITKYAGVFTASGAVASPSGTSNQGTPGAVVAAAGEGVKAKGGATSHTKPESASKKTQVKVPAKRGRKGDKITKALQAVTSTPVAIDSFIKQHGVSLAVLRQSKRFLEKLDTTTAKKIGKINVRQDKASKQLMIWREEV